MKTSYKFYNQYNTLLHFGEHATNDEAWQAFFVTCNYPEYAKDVEQAKELGIYFVMGC